MSAQTLLSAGDKWFSYSGEVFGDVSVPATIPLINIPNTGLRDSYVQIQSFYGLAVSSSGTQQLGIQVKLNDVIVLKAQGREYTREYQYPFNLFVPRQSKLEIVRLNMTSNNTQISGCNVIGYYL